MKGEEGERTANWQSDRITYFLKVERTARSAGSICVEREKMVAGERSLTEERAGVEKGWT